MAEITQSATAPKPFYTYADLQARWGVARMTIHREVQRGRLKKKRIGRTVRFAADEVARYEREVDVVTSVPVPDVTKDQRERAARLARATQALLRGHANAS